MEVRWEEEVSLATVDPFWGNMRQVKDLADSHLMGLHTSSDVEQLSADTCSTTSETAMYIWHAYIPTNKIQVVKINVDILYYTVAFLCI